MRTFVAIELDDRCRENLATAIERMEHAVKGIKWVAPQSAHLTIKFIGQLEEEMLPHVVAVLQEAARQVSPFTMEVEGISAFPSEHRPRVIHAPVEEPGGELLKLAETVEVGLAEALGIRKEKRRFIPHVTLGRKRKGHSCPPIEELTREVQDLHFGRVQVQSVVLMKSDLTPRGAVYTPLERISLGSQ